MYIIKIIRGDITKITDVQVIVNAGNIRKVEYI